MSHGLEELISFNSLYKYSEILYLESENYRISWAGWHPQELLSPTPELTEGHLKAKSCS